MQKIIQDVTNLFRKYLVDLHLTLKAELRTNSVSEEVVTSLNPHFSPEGKYGKPFRGLETEYYQLKYFKEHLSMVVRIMCIV